MLILRFYSGDLVLKEWVFNGNKDIEKVVIEMIDTDIKFLNKIRGFKNE